MQHWREYYCDQNRDAGMQHYTGMAGMQHVSPYRNAADIGMQRWLVFQEP